MTYGCEILFSRERAEAVQELVEATTGQPCPCKQGWECPLLPSGAVGLTLTVVEPAA